MANNLASTAPDASGKDGTHGESDFMKLARDRYAAAYAREEQNILEAYEDLRFRAGEQWDQDVEQERIAEGRPVMTVNKIPQYVRQITGDIRQMRPSIKAVPVDSRGDPETADVVGGMIRYIENRSVAKAAYFAGADSQVTCGIGHWRVETEYADDSTFNQEIRISPVEDQVLVLWDPDAKLQTRADGQFCFVPYDLSSLEFRRRYPDANGVEMPGPDDSTAFMDWYSEDYIRVAEYWFKDPIERTLFLSHTGEVIDCTGDDEALQMAQALMQHAQANGIPARIEKRPGHVVKRAVISATEVIEEETEWKGRHIPIIRCQGEEVKIGRKVYRHGAVRFCRDPQRRYNYYVSAQTETVALQPKAPFIGTTIQFQKHYDQWDAANTSNKPFLEYTPDPLAGGAPQRVQPAVNSAGIAEGLQLAEADMQSTTGIYNASLGKQGNETSGVAITARQREGDTGSFVYVDNFAQAVCHTGTVIADLIPHVYDTQREIRILGIDGQESTVQLNKPVGLEVGEDDAPVSHDVTVGAYDVVMEMGPSYSTKREEARDGMTELMKAIPDVAPSMLDLYVKAQDWPQAEAIRERVKLLAPPAIQAMMAKEDGEEPPPPPPPSPADQAAAAEAEQAKAQAAQEAEVSKAELQIKLKELALKERELDVRLQEIDAELAKAHMELAGDAVEHNANVAEAEAAAAGGQEGGAVAGGTPGAAPAPDMAAMQSEIADLKAVLVHVMEVMAGKPGHQPPGAVPQGEPIAAPPVGPDAAPGPVGPGAEGPVPVAAPVQAKPPRQPFAAAI